jgi:hypothetical protein
MGNGGPETGDGWKYRGRGILQTTGREAYRKYGRRCGVDFEGSPELVLSAEHALKPALAEWVDGGCNKLADAGDIKSITRRINGGLIGYESRCAWLRRIEKVLGESTIDFKPRSTVDAAMTEKPKAASATIGGAVVLGTTSVMTADGSNHLALWILGGVAAAALIVGAIILIRHHLTVKPEA